MQTRFRAMVGSDMEPTDARKAYPCFDEPAMKIRYTTTLIHEPEHVALSNMNVEVHRRGPQYTGEELSAPKNLGVMMHLYAQVRSHNFTCVISCPPFMAPSQIFCSSSFFRRVPAMK